MSRFARWGSILSVMGVLSVLALPTIKSLPLIVRAWLATVRVNPKDGLPYVFIAPGTFTMGCSPGDNNCSNDESPHPVAITKGFWMGQTEVTQAAYKASDEGRQPQRVQG